MNKEKSYYPWGYDYTGDSGTGMIKPPFPPNGEGVNEGEMKEAINSAVNNLVNGAPEALDTLKEIADALKNDDTVIDTLLGEIDKKIDDEQLKTYVTEQLNDYLSEEAAKNKYQPKGEYLTEQNLSEYAKSADVTEKINAAVEDKVSKTDLNNALNERDYASNEDVDNKIAEVSEGLQETINNKIDNLVSADEEIKSELNKKVEWADIATESNPNRKSIVFNNHDTLLGKTTDGSTANIAMISKWNVVDLGTTKLPINLNTPKNVRPTVQEAGQSGEDANKIAYVSDIDAVSDKISELENTLSETASQNSVDELTNQVALKANSANVYTKIEIDGKDYASKAEVDARIKTVVGDAPEALDTLKEIADRLESDNDAIVAINGILAGKANSDDVYTKTEVNEKLDLKANTADLNTYASKIALDGVSQKTFDNATAIDGLKEHLKEKQDKGNYISYTDDKGRKIITLNNADIFGANANTEELESKVDITGWVSLMQLNKWNVVDIGSPKTITNINTPDGFRPTVQEKSQSGPEAHKIAYLDDIEKLKTVNYHEINDKDFEKPRKVVTLDNGELIQANSNNNELVDKVDVEGKAISLIQLNRWNVVDIGSPYTITNINVPDGVRPTVQEKSQSGPNANQIAYLSDIKALENEIKTLKEKIEALENK